MEVVLFAVILAYLSGCAYACRRVAEAKARGPEEWFVCGLIFGLVAFLVIIVLPPLRTDRR